jgi:hypothetical protein
MAVVAAAAVKPLRKLILPYLSSPLPLGESAKRVGILRCYGDDDCSTNGTEVVSRANRWRRARVPYVVQMTQPHRPVGAGDHDTLNRSRRGAQFSV